MLSIKYKREPIIPQYFVMLIFLPFSSISSFVDVFIGVSASFTCSIPNLFSKSLMYLSWLMRMPSFIFLIYNPRKKFNSPIILISNSSCMHFVKSIHRDSLIAPKIISLTYICTINISLYFFFVKMMVSILPIMKPF